jgi:hypothetical protein
MSDKQCEVCKKIYNKKYDCNKRFCSWNCYIIFHKGEVEQIKCPVCSKVVVKYKCQKNKFCSRECKNRSQIGISTLSGKNHYRWKGGITPKNKVIRKSIEYYQWRNKVFLRDNWTCQDCNKRGGTIIHPHHIKSFAKYPELRFDVNNGITLCEICHRKRHNFKPSVRKCRLSDKEWQKQRIKKH